jgi:hypothetical protein
MLKSPAPRRTTVEGRLAGFDLHGQALEDRKTKLAIEKPLVFWFPSEIFSRMANDQHCSGSSHKAAPDVILVWRKPDDDAMYWAVRPEYPQSSSESLAKVKCC